MANTTIATEQQPKMDVLRHRMTSLILPWALLGILAVFPLVAPAWQLDYYIGFVRHLLIVMIAATSLNFILGFGGMTALGHAGFIGVGAYTVVALVDSGFTSAWGAWMAASCVAAAVAAVIGALSLRTRGVYFLMLTLAFSQMLYYLAVSLRTYGGDDGYGLYTPLALGWGLGNAQGQTFYWVVLAITTLFFAFLNRVAVSRFGYALRGVRENEIRMTALGYPVFWIRLTAFIAAGAMAGLAGGLLACHNQFVSPSLMHWTESVTLLVIIVIGGLGHRWGAAIGVTVWLSLAEVLKMHTEYWRWPLGLLLILIVFLAPRGLAALGESRGPGK